MAQFSSSRKYPLTLKPLTLPDVRQTHQDVFNLQNTFRLLFTDLDEQFAALSALIGSGNAGEILVSDTDNNPPVMLTNEDGTDFVYST